jgi:very-short-patch-repair endonuclease
VGVTTQMRVLAASQHGVIARRQAHAAGATSDEIVHWIKTGAWVVAGRVALRLAGAPPTDKQRALIAVFDAGCSAALSHGSAAALWDLPGFRLTELHVTRPRGRSRRRYHFAEVHETRVLLDRHVTVHEGIPVTTPARTIFDLAALLHPKRVERALETAWSNHLIDGRRMAAVLDDLGKRGRTGTTVMREILADRGPDYVPADSGLEGRFRDVLQRDGQAPMVRQIDVGGDRWLGRIDFLDRDAKLIVQIDSDRYHGSLIDKAADKAQTAALEGAGFVVERFTDFEVWYCADEVARRVRKARRRRRSGE